jgi:hypothetical protein
VLFTCFTQNARCDDQQHAREHSNEATGSVKGREFHDWLTDNLLLRRSYINWVNYHINDMEKELQSNLSRLHWETRILTAINRKQKHAVKYIGFEVHTKVAMKSSVFWDIVLCPACCLLHVSFLLFLFLDPEEGGDMFLSNVC